jgi:hypothetical protein
MKSRDEISRQLSRIILDAAQGEADATGEFMVPANVLDDLRPPERVTVDMARRACSIEDRVWEQELHRHMVVAEIMGGVRPSR